MPDVTVPGATSAPELRAHLAVPPVGTGPWPGWSCCTRCSG
jgi:carboxymethylenebutenolidase